MVVIPVVAIGLFGLPAQRASALRIAEPRKKAAKPLRVQKAVPKWSKKCTNMAEIWLKHGWNMAETWEHHGTSYRRTGCSEKEMMSVFRFTGASQRVNGYSNQTMIRKCRWKPQSLPTDLSRHQPNQKNNTSFIIRHILPCRKKTAWLCHRIGGHGIPWPETLQTHPSQFTTLDPREWPDGVSKKANLPIESMCHVVKTWWWLGLWLFEPH